MRAKEKILYWANIKLYAKKYDNKWTLDTSGLDSDNIYVKESFKNEYCWYTLPIVAESQHHNYGKVYKFLKPTFDLWKVRNKSFTSYLGCNFNFSYGEGWTADELVINSQPHPCQLCGWYCFQQCVAKSSFIHKEYRLWKIVGD